MKRQILELFTRNASLKFSEIEKQLATRSNKLAYHLKNLIAEGILIKSQDSYALAESAEPLIPYISEKKALLPVLLIHIGDNKKAFLITREKRPYKNSLALPAGRILLGESLPQATQRIMQEKYGIAAQFKALHSVSLEHVLKKEQVLHSFVLLFVSATSLAKLPLAGIRKHKSKAIASDYHLLTHDLNKKMKLKTLNSRVD